MAYICWVTIWQAIKNDEWSIYNYIYIRLCIEVVKILLVAWHKNSFLIQGGNDRIVFGEFNRQALGVFSYNSDHLKFIFIKIRRIWEIPGINMIWTSSWSVLFSLPRYYATISDVKMICCYLTRDHVYCCLQGLQEGVGIYEWWKFTLRSTTKSFCEPKCICVCMQVHAIYHKNCKRLCLGAGTFLGTLHVFSIQATKIPNSSEAASKSSQNDEFPMNCMHSGICLLSLTDVNRT